MQSNHSGAVVVLALPWRCYGQPVLQHARFLSNQLLDHVSRVQVYTVARCVSVLEPSTANTGRVGLMVHQWKLNHGDILRL